MKCKFNPKTLLILAISVTLPLTAFAAPINQGLPLPDGSLQQGSNNHTKMAKGGRYVPFNSDGSLFVRDIKTQVTTLIAPSISDRNYFSISPNGRYVSYSRRKSNNAGSETVILDRVTQTETIIAAQSSQNIGLSDNGYAFFNKLVGTNTELVRYQIKNQQEELVNDSQAKLGSFYQPNPLSKDGNIGLFKSGGYYKIYNGTTKAVTTLKPTNAQGIPIPIDAGDYSSANISLSSSGKFVTFVTSSTDPIQRNSLYVLDLEAPAQVASVFAMGAKNITVGDGLSISHDGRFISFRGDLNMGHPEWFYYSGTSTFPRIFRYDTQQNELVTMSKKYNGTALESKPSAGSLYSPLVNGTSVISDDGSMVEFATSSPSVSSTINLSASEANYHAYVSNGFARNYQFVEMPNSEINFLPYAPMTLVGNNVWEGSITFDGIGTDSFYIDAGGVLSNGKFTAAPNGSIRFGTGSTTTGPLIIAGNNISITGGPGVYKITFNDQTRNYTVTKQEGWQRTVVMIYGQTQSGQDMFIRGGLDHQQALIKLGKNCDANNSLCSMPIRHLNKLNPTTAPWKQGDTKLDWQDIAEPGQGANAKGSPLDWTTDYWPTSWGAKKTVAINGYGETPINLWGQHYWLLDVEMDCSKTYNGWFEVKSFISGGPGWESNITQPGAPWPSINHFAQCGKLNVFKRGQNAPVTIGNF